MALKKKKKRTASGTAGLPTKHIVSTSHPQPGPLLSPSFYYKVFGHTTYGFRLPAGLSLYRSVPGLCEGWSKAIYHLHLLLQHIHWTKLWHVPGTKGAPPFGASLTLESRSLLRPIISLCIDNHPLTWKAPVPFHKWEKNHKGISKARPNVFHFP